MSDDIVKRLRALLREARPYVSHHGSERTNDLLVRIDDALNKGGGGMNEISLEYLPEEKISLLARCVYERLEQIAPSDGETWDDLDEFDKEGYRRTVLAVLEGIISLPVSKGGA